MTRNQASEQLKYVVHSVGEEASMSSNRRYALPCLIRRKTDTFAAHITLTHAILRT